MCSLEGMINFLNNISNVRALQLFQIMRYGVLILIRVALAKLGILTDEIGEFEYFLFLASAVSFFWVTGILQSLLPLNHKSKTFGKNEQRSPELYNAFLLISAFTLLVILLLGGYNMSDLGETTPHFGYLLLFLLFTTPSFLVEYIYLLYNKPIRLLLYGTIVFTVQLLLVLIPIILGWSIEFAYLGLVIFSLLKFVWLLTLLAKYAQRNFSLTYIKEHMKLGLPLIISAFFGGSAQFIDGFIIKARFDESTFAVFLYGAKELPFVYLLANMLSNAMVVRVSHEENLSPVLNELKKESLKLMHVLFPVSILLVLGSNYFYPLIFRSDFAESAKIFNIYLLLVISRLVFPQTILIGLKRTGIILRMSLTELILNVTLSLIFINWWGIVGVAYATVIAYFVDKIYLVIMVKKDLSLGPASYIPVRLLLIYSILLLVSYFVSDYFLF